MFLFQSFLFSSSSFFNGSQARGTDVYLVSGGFRLMIDPVAEALGLPRGRVFANTILFDEAGR